MKRHFFINKMNTIFQGSESNFGNSPICELNYGNGISRILLDFDIDEIKGLVEDHTFSDLSKLSHRIVMTNCGSIDLNKNDITINGASDFPKNRTHSFDVIAFRLPREFDEGTGSSLSKDAFIDSEISYSKDGSNWFQAKNGDLWKPNEETDLGIKGLDNGVYSTEYLGIEFEKYLAGEESEIVVGYQHFDNGYENLSIDLSGFINNIVKNNENFYGIGLAYSYREELKESDISEYVGFFSNNTNTMYHPYIETYYDDSIDDSRMNFQVGKDNRLYLYCNENGNPINLDNIPTCSIDDEEVSDVYQAQKGVYCALIPAKSISGSNYTMKYDTWSNLALNGVSLEDVELTFVLQPSGFNLSMSGISQPKDEAFPSVYNINDNEELLPDNRYEVGVMFSKKYSFGERENIEGCEYRIRVKEGADEIILFDFSPINLKNGNYCFDIFTNDFVPGKYFIDLKVKNGNSIKTYKDVCHFRIKNDVTNRYK